MKDKRFIIRKYVDAPSAKEAIEREASLPVDEVYLDTASEPSKGSADAIGFNIHQEPDWRNDEIRARRKR